MKVLEIVEALARMKKQERLQFAESMIDRFPNLAEELCVLLESNPEPEIEDFNPGGTI